MTDQHDFDDILDEGPTDVRAWFKKDVKSRGLRTAYQAALSVCADAKAPAPARATAAGLLLRAAGVLDKANDDDDDTPIANLTFAQLQERYDRLEAEAAERNRSRRRTRGSKTANVFD